MTVAGPYRVAMQSEKAWVESSTLNEETAGRARVRKKKHRTVAPGISETNRTTLPSGSLNSGIERTSNRQNKRNEAIIEKESTSVVSVGVITKLNNPLEKP